MIAVINRKDLQQYGQQCLKISTLYYLPFFLYPLAKGYGTPCTLTLFSQDSYQTMCPKSGKVCKERISHNEEDQKEKISEIFKTVPSTSVELNINEIRWFRPVSINVSIVIILLEVVIK